MTSGMVEKDIMVACSASLDKMLGIPETTKAVGREGLANAIYPYIEHLLNREFERLLQLCYKIDLEEEKLKKILHSSSPESMVNDLCLAIIDRQILKCAIREKYNSGFDPQEGS